ncbi:hypothetical protein OUZ56_000470 [Daphnia magna]|uniref:Uncharacterized protein n=1 Tax=Daphnia magna TaxID=35525 RepID=A0ABR0A0K1_9CRUS|nr:hypothetical protein OUZ56_000470 [Daphnia magna]
MKRLHIFQEKLGTGTWFWLETIYFIEFTGYGIVLIFKEMKCFTLVTDSFRSNVQQIFYAIIRGLTSQPREIGLCERLFN